MIEYNGKKFKPREDILIESLSHDMGYFFRSREVLYKGKTPFQDMEFHEFRNYGRILRLDGIFQTSDRDEFLFHEPLAHVPGISMNGPKKALVIGGGDGGSAEELLKYNTIEKVVMVELDPDVVEYSKKYLPSISNGAFDDPRMELRIEDGIKFIKETDEKFDHVLLDLTDPLGPSVFLYTKEFYQAVDRILTPNGALTLHIESPVTRPAIFSGLFWTLKSVFKNVRPMLNYVPLYGTLWGYAMASQNVDPLDISPDQVEQRIKDLGLTDLQFYNKGTHFSLMALPNYIAALITEPKEPFTEASPLNVEGELLRKLSMFEEE